MVVFQFLSRERWCIVGNFNDDIILPSHSAPSTSHRTDSHFSPWGGFLCQWKNYFSATARRCFHLTFHSVTTYHRNRFVSAPISTGSFSRLVRLPVLCTATGIFRLDRGASTDEQKSSSGSPLHCSSSTPFITFNRAFSSFFESQAQPSSV